MADAQAFIAIWPRGFSKSTYTELANVYIGARGSVLDQLHTDLEADYLLWLMTLFPEYMGGQQPFALASYHHELWQWVAEQSYPRRYGVYVSDTQEQAEQHVANIADMLTSPIFARWYPRMARRRVTKYGSSAGWRRTRLRTASGFTVDAAGLDKGIRGAKVEEDRPDIITFDDLDRENDSPSVTQRKIANLTRSIIPAQADNAIFLGAQNLVIRGGIFTQLADGTADFLTRRIVSGPHPALEGFDPERDLRGREDGGWDIVGGRPTWRDRAHVQRLLDTYGRQSFLIECQQRLQDAGHLIYSQFSPDIHNFTYAQLPEFVAYYGGLDFGGEGEDAHHSTVVVLGLTRSGRLLLLYEWYGNGPNIEERQMLAIDECHAIFGFGIRWEQDGDERTYFQTLRRRAGMHTLRMSKRTPFSAKERRRQFGFLLNVEGDRRTRFYYLERPRTITGMDGKPHTIGGGHYSTAGSAEPLVGASRFRYEVERWHRKAHAEGEAFADDPVPVEDDVLVGVLYATERYNTDEDVPQGAQRVLVSA